MRQQAPSSSGSRPGPATRLRVTYIGHATLLLEIGGARILTDPNFDSHLGGILPRVSPPGIPMAQLPALDGILLTHAHADHLSFPSLDALPREVPIYAPPVIAQWLKRRGYAQAVALLPGEGTNVGPVQIRAAAAHHQGARYAVDRWRGAANMYLLDVDGTSCFFAGDTALMPDSHRMVIDYSDATGRRLDVALLPIGYAPWWKPGFRRNHLTVDDALTFFERLDARFFIPYHWGTFQHVTAGPYDAIVRLRQRAATHTRHAGVKVLDPGSAFDVYEPAS